jgi:hypothetical protein
MKRIIRNKIKMMRENYSLFFSLRLLEIKNKNSNKILTTMSFSLRVSKRLMRIMFFSILPHCTHPLQNKTLLHLLLLLLK